MTSKYKEDIDNLINSGKSKILPKLERYAKKNNNDSYILYRIAVYKCDTNTPGAEDDFKNLMQDMEYYYISIYHLSYLYIDKENHEEAVKYLERLIASDCEFCIEAHKSCVQEYYLVGEFKKSLSHYLELEKEELNNDTTYYYAAKSYLELGMFAESLNAIKKAIYANPSERLYFEFVKNFPKDKDTNELVLRTVNNILLLDTPYRDELRLMVPYLMYRLRYVKEALGLIEYLESQKITSVTQQLLNFKICANIGNDVKAEQIIMGVNSEKSIKPEYLVTLFKMYNREGLYDKAFDVIDVIEEGHKDYSSVQYYRAITLMQMGRYDEAEALLDEAISSKIYSKTYNSDRDLIDLSKFERTLALCLYLNDKNEDAEEIMSSLKYSDGHKTEILLRHELGLPQEKVAFEDRLYQQFLEEQNFNSREDREEREKLSYKYIRNMLNSDKSMCNVTENTNLRKFVDSVRAGIQNMKPTYSLNSDTYLINYGEAVGTINGQLTKYFIAETIPGGELFNIRPVIPTSKENFSRIRTNK